MRISLLSFFILVYAFIYAQTSERKVINFNKEWRFYYADTTDISNQYNQLNYNDSKWRIVNVPHDWSIEFPFDKNNPSTAEGGALPGGIGWYRKNFALPNDSKTKQISIEFDGVYCCSEVWINGHLLGFRPNGYVSFRYDLTPYLNFGAAQNVVAVKVDNSKQMNSRWYSGSGIYRNVRMVYTNPIVVNHWGTFVTANHISSKNATLNITTSINNTFRKNTSIELKTIVLDKSGKQIAQSTQSNILLKDSLTNVATNILVNHPILWSIENPYLYKVVTKVIQKNKIIDQYETTTGIRSFYFDRYKGFFLNGKATKILGVCNHHDLGCLGAAINVGALKRQLIILKSFGCNAIRTSHNPPAPELLNLCDEMGFLVMDESFDMWAKQKTKFDYHLYWKDWHQKDLEDFVKRDRNHPSVFLWSIGNEIPEQRSKEGASIAEELFAIVRSLDTTRPIVTGNDQPYPSKNFITKTNLFDVIGFNYHHQLYASFLDSFPGKKFIATETTSGLETRGEYFFPSDSIRVWPTTDKQGMNSDYTVSAYDNTRAPWSSTHEQAWKEVKKYDFLSGMFIWTGFDYLGEPTPYSWPAKSSYFGIVDLAGFPKDVYYMYQSEWTNKDVLHLLPHWNWKVGDSVDVWAYYNHADEVELFVNGKSAGIKKKLGDDLHVMWRVLYEPGSIKAVSRKNGKIFLTKHINTAGIAAKLRLVADKKVLIANSEDQAFVKVEVLDIAGNIVPNADNLIRFTLKGESFIAGVDNGNPVSHEPFKANNRRAFNGLALAIIQAKEKKGTVQLIASSDGIQSAQIQFQIH